MKLNQFAIQPVDDQTIKKELAAIGFLPLKLAKDPKKMFQQLLTLSFPEQTAIAQVFDKLLATDQMTLAQFFASAQPLTVEVFYTVALQLLAFQVPVDFTGPTVLADAKKIGIRTVADISNRQAMLTAWYELLNTHTKKGLTFLDDLASRGFYQLQPVEKPLFFNGKAQAVFDTQGLIREVVYVETPLDTDQDGQRDLIKVEVIRPHETNSGLQVPVLYTASPYNQGTNPELGKKAMHEMNVPLTRKTPNQVTMQDVAYQAPPVVVPPVSKPARTVRHATETFTNEKAVVLNDYFLARGFAAVYSAGIGTRDSDGIQTCGSVEQTIATVAVIEWLAGNRQAFTDHTRQTAIKAWWCNGQVAMTGKSYLGTLAIAAATMGVPGLATIISEAAISNWYQYYRDNGLVVAPGGFPGEDADVLAIETMSRMQDAGDYLKVKAYFEKSMTAMQTAQDRLTGDYNSFWDERNYLPHVKRIKCAILSVHGLNDWNVKLRHVYELHQALTAQQITHKMILHQGQHIYIHNMPSLDFLDMMNLWLSHHLYHIQNDVQELLPPIIYQDNRTPETWHPLQTWASPTKFPKWYLGQEALCDKKASGTVTIQNQFPEAQFLTFAADSKSWQKGLTDESTEMAQRYLVKTAPLAKDCLLAGAAQVTLTVKSSVDFGMLSVQLVDFGKSKRLTPQPATIGFKELALGPLWKTDDLKEFTLGESTPNKMITKGHLNLQNRHHPWRTDDLVAGEYVTVQITLQPMLYHLMKGHQLGLIVYGTDFGMTVRGNQAINYTISLADSYLELPQA